MNKECKNCWANYEITQDDMAFYDKVSPVFNWKKHQIPAPKFCPDCRQQRRLCFKSSINLYKRKCNFSWKNIVSMYNSDVWTKVYDNDVWWSDQWDAKDHWRIYNFKNTFFEQFSELLNDVPKMAKILLWENENSEYCNCTSFNKNCYLMFTAWKNEDCYYWNWVDKCKDCVDNYKIIECEQAYQCVDCIKSFQIYNCQQINNSSNIYYSSNCRNSNNLFACTWLRNKENYILNKKVSKQEFDTLLTDEESKKNILVEYEKLLSNQPRLYANFSNSENFSWWYINNCKNVNYCWDVYHLEDSKFCNDLIYANHCYDVSHYWCISSNELLLECESAGVWTSNVIFSKSIWWWCNNIIYSYECFSSQYLFWCTWLKRAKYCIFNKQYTKEEYEELVPKIIEHMKSTWEWWEFFPINLSYFSYNETEANEIFPLTKNIVNKNGWKWKEEEDKIPNVTKTIPAEKLPINISDIPDDVLNWAIKCQASWRPFKLIPQELKFYREHNIPVPHLHPDERHKARMKLRNPRKLYDRNCTNCTKSIQTTYAPDKPEIVYCEECYLKEIY